LEDTPGTSEKSLAPPQVWIWISGGGAGKLPIKQLPRWFSCTNFESPGTKESCQFWAIRIQRLSLQIALWLWRLR
jgi:hypothetical protein